ncbi:MAG: SDR family oxidoreductase [Deltaproteobacteria bacterium]|nr:SDR family oxidoreductase [Deltaproteobacteria bacterium]
MGKTILVTGPTSGIGAVSARELARLGATVYLACRDEAKARPLVESIAAGGGKSHVLALDLGDLSSVRRCAERFLATGDPLHVLVNNAGIAGMRGVTKDGFELAFGTNHLGHFLLTALLFPRLRESAPARIVNVASTAHYRARGIDFDLLRRKTRSLTGWPEYGVSKLCNVLFTRELERRLGHTGVHAYAVHPGVVGSDLWRRIPWPFAALMKTGMKTNEEGARSTIHCASSPEVESLGGRFFDEDCSERKPSRPARDDELARKLWEKSAEWCGTAPGD